MAKDRKGKCSSCGDPHLPGKTRCQACTDRAAERARATYQARKALAVCPQCKRNPVSPGMSCCEGCLAYHRNKTATNREAYAPRQRVLARQWYDERVASGICPECNERPARPARTTCAPCGHRMAENSRKHAMAARNVVLGHYGARCDQCGEGEVQFLQIDHVEGGGNDHRREIGQGALYRWLIDNGFPSGFRTLCASCNFEKGLLVRNRLEADIALPTDDIPCFYCKTAMARIGRFSCHACALKHQRRDKASWETRRSAVLDHYGRKCACCGSTRAPQIDHIQGGGRAHRGEIGSSALYRWLIKNAYPAGFQTLCANCNFAKGHYGMCPHRRDTTLAARATKKRQLVD